MTVGAWPADMITLLTITFSANRIASVTQKRRLRMGASMSGRLEGGGEGAGVRAGGGGLCAIRRSYAASAQQMRPR